MRLYFQPGDPAAQAVASLVASQASRVRVVRVSPLRWTHIQIELGVDNPHVRYESKTGRLGAPVQMVFPMAGLVVAIEADPDMPFEQVELL